MKRIHTLWDGLLKRILVHLVGWSLKISLLREKDFPCGACLYDDSLPTLVFGWYAHKVLL